MVTFERESLPTTEWLSQRIHELQARLPDLKATLVESPPSSDEQHWHSPVHFEEHEAWAAKDVLRDVALVESSATSAFACFEDDMTSFEQEEMMGGPQFRVTRYASPSAPSGCIALSVWHVYTDGIGAVNLLRALLCPNLEDIPDESTTNMFTQSKAELYPVNPDPIKLPPPDGDKAAVWPYTGQAFEKPAKECHPSFAEVAIDAPLLKVVKNAALTHGVQTLNPILLATFLKALHKTVPPGDYRFKAVVPHNLRDPASPPFMSGSIVTAHSYDTPRDMPDTWQLCQAIDKQFRDEGAALPPMPPKRRLPFTAYSHLVEAWDSVMGYGDTLVFSNLSRWAWLDDIKGATDAVWGQSCGQCFPPVAVHLAGVKGSCRATLAYRDGFGFDRQMIDKLAENWLAELTVAAKSEH